MAVVFHQASIQERLELEQSVGGEAGLLIAGEGLRTLTCREKGENGQQTLVKIMPPVETIFKLDVSKLCIE